MTARTARIAFVPNPHLRFECGRAVPYVALESLSAMASAQAAGAQVLFLDPNREVEQGAVRLGPGIWPWFARRIADAQVDAVVFETWTPTLHHTLRFARAVRERSPAVRIVLFGAGVSAIAADVRARFEFLDDVLVGEPEPAMALLGANATSDLENAARAVADVGALPWPDYRAANLVAGEAIPIETGRGCELECSFCALTGYWAHQYRHRPINQIAEMMRVLAAEYPGSQIDLTGDARFFADPARTLQLCDSLEALRVRVAWTCVARADCLDERLLERMARAGCRGVLFGTESGALRIQESCGKRVDTRRLVELVRAATRMGIETRCTFIVGWPDETLAELEATAALTLQCRRAGGVAFVEALRAYPGSRIDREAVETAPEPLFGAVGRASGDPEGEALIAAHPDLFPAGRYVASALGRGQALGAWLALSAYGEVLAALEHRGVALGRLLRASALDAVPSDCEQALERIATSILAEARGAAGVEEAVLADALSLHRALRIVGMAIPDPPAAASDIAKLRETPEKVVVHAVAPWRLLPLLHDPEALLDAPLEARPSGGSGISWTLIANVRAQAASTFYTRRGSRVEMYGLEEVAARFFMLGDWDAPLGRRAERVAASIGMKKCTALEVCAQVVVELVDAGVIAVRAVG